MRHDFSDVTSRSEAERLGRLYPIILREYNPEYKALYARERDYLLDVFSGLVLRISHIGSTAVPNLVSKPTIDILLEISENSGLSEITERLAQNGYIVNTPPADIILYIKGYGPNGFDGQTYHIHVRALGDYSEFYFRDYLIAHPDAAAEYGQLKRHLQERYEHDRDGYTAAQSAFVAKHTKLARAEFAGKYSPAK